MRGFGSWGLGVGSAGLGLVAGVIALGAALAYPDAPPPAHTGGFGEPTCHRCHFDQPLGPAGALRLDGLPEVPEAGRRYRLTLTLGHAAMQRAGFQLAARHADGRSAGLLEPLDDRTAPLADTSGIVYLQHTEAGSHLATPDTARWAFAWTAPEVAGVVVFHAAANAANGDASEFGDVVFPLAIKTDSP